MFQVNIFIKSESTEWNDTINVGDEVSEDDLKTVKEEINANHENSETRELKWETAENGTVQGENLLKENESDLVRSTSRKRSLEEGEYLERDEPDSR